MPLYNLRLNYICHLYKSQIKLHLPLYKSQNKLPLERLSVHKSKTIPHQPMHSTQNESRIFIKSFSYIYNNNLKNSRLNLWLLLRRRLSISCGIFRFSDKPMGVLKRITITRVCVFIVVQRERCQPVQHLAIVKKFLFNQIINKNVLQKIGSYCLIMLH